MTRDRESNNSYPPRKHYLPGDSLHPKLRFWQKNSPRRPRSHRGQGCTRPDKRLFAFRGRVASVKQLPDHERML